MFDAVATGDFLFHHRINVHVTVHNNIYLQIYRAIWFYHWVLLDVLLA